MENKNPLMPLSWIYTFKTMKNNNCTESTPGTSTTPVKRNPIRLRSTGEIVWVSQPMALARPTGSSVGKSGARNPSTPAEVT